MQSKNKILKETLLNKWQNVKIKNEKVYKNKILFKLLTLLLTFFFKKGIEFAVDK